MRTFYIISRFCKCHIEEVLLKIWESTWSKYFKYLVCLCLFLLPYLSIYPFITHTHAHTHIHTPAHTHTHTHTSAHSCAHRHTHIGRGKDRDSKIPESEYLDAKQYTLLFALSKHTHTHKHKITIFFCTIHTSSTHRHCHNHCILYPFLYLETLCVNMFSLCVCMYSICDVLYVCMSVRCISVYVYKLLDDLNF